MRQPQTAKNSGDIICERPAATKEPINVPTAALKMALQAAKPRLFAGACSATNVIAPLNSPPSERPCSKRMMVSRMGAQIPICA